MIKIPFLRALAMLFYPSGLLNPSSLRSTKRQILELFFSVFIISILITISAPTYSDCRLKAKITHFAGELDTKRSIHTFHAVNGTWPRDNKQLKEFESEIGINIYKSKENHNTFKSPFIENSIIENGAFHVLFKEELEGKILSIRPAVPKMDVTGPIILVCSKNKAGWNIAGKDKTTIDDRLINRFLR